MIGFGLGFLFGCIVGVFITALCATSSHNDLNIEDNMEEMNE